MVVCGEKRGVGERFNIPAPPPSPRFAVNTPERKVPRVFELVKEFVPEVAAAASSRGRLLLLNGEPGGGMFCLESNRHVGHLVIRLSVPHIHTVCFVFGGWGGKQGKRPQWTMAHELRSTCATPP